MRFYWSQEKITKAVGLWKEGKSGLFIANVLGTTRNSVLGKLNRLGHLKKSRDKLTQHQVAAAKASKPAKPKPLIVKEKRLKAEIIAPQPKTDFDIPKKQRKTVETLGPHDCRWPVGDPKRGEFFFCGAQAPEGKPYCNSHSIRAYLPPQKRRYAAPRRSQAA
jgi:GcrA cell cycle regulator